MWTGWEVDVKLGLLIVIGCVLIFNREMEPAHMKWKAAAWLPVYLVGMGVITFFSTFSQRTHPGAQMGVWTSLGVCAVFAVAIYYWAIAVALPSEVIQRMVDEVVVPEEEDLALPAGH